MDDQDNRSIGAWCATDRVNQWLQIDLDKDEKVRAVATQGNPYRQIVRVFFAVAWISFNGDSLLSFILSPSFFTELHPN